jgi:hypothetical protein
MATSVEITERIDGELEAVEEMVAELEEVACEWTNMPESVRVSWSLDWDQAMGTLMLELASTDVQGQMSDEQIVKYQSLLASLKRAMPTIVRLNLYRPPVPLDS